MWQFVAYVGMVGFGLIWLTLFAWGNIRLWKQRKNSRIRGQSQQEYR